MDSDACSSSSLCLSFAGPKREGIFSCLIIIRSLISLSLSLTHLGFEAHSSDGNGESL